MNIFTLFTLSVLISCPVFAMNQQDMLKSLHFNLQETTQLQKMHKEMVSSLANATDAEIVKQQDKLNDLLLDIANKRMETIGLSRKDRYIVMNAYGLDLWEDEGHSSLYKVIGYMAMGILNLKPVLIFAPGELLRFVQLSLEQKWLKGISTDLMTSFEIAARVGTVEILGTIATNPNINKIFDPQYLIDHKVQENIKELQKKVGDIGWTSEVQRYEAILIYLKKLVPEDKLKINNNGSHEEQQAFHI